MPGSQLSNKKTKIPGSIPARKKKLIHQIISKSDDLLRRHFNVDAAFSVGATDQELEHCVVDFLASKPLQRPEENVVKSCGQGTLVTKSNVMRANDRARLPEEFLNHPNLN
jgi:hypothetical protein